MLRFRALYIRPTTGNAAFIALEDYTNSVVSRASTVCMVPRWRVRCGPCPPVLLCGTEVVIQIKPESKTASALFADAVINSDSDAITGNRKRLTVFLLLLQVRIPNLTAQALDWSVPALGEYFSLAIGRWMLSSPK